MMFQCSTFLLIFMAPAAARVFHGKWQGAHKMDVDMRPEVVSTLLSTVEAKWVQGAVDVMSNQTEESIAFNAMESSCVKVSSAVVQGADGDRDRVIQYMTTVCNEPNAKSNIAMCTEFANAMQEFMVGDNEYNREQLDMHNFCQKFWSTSVTSAAKAQEQKLVEEEKKRLEAWAEEKKREADEAEQKKKLAAEAAQKAAHEAEEKKLAEMAQEAEEKKKLAETVAKNSTSFSAATQMNLRSNQTMSTPQLGNTSTSATASTVTTENKTETLENTTTLMNANVQKDKTLQNVTVESTQTVQKNQTQAMENFSPKLVLKNSSRVDTASNNQSIMNSTLKVVLKNTSAVVVNEVQTKLQGNLTQRVRKHLKFIMNHTKNVTA